MASSKKIFKDIKFSMIIESFFIKKKDFYNLSRIIILEVINYELL